MRGSVEAFRKLQARLKAIDHPKLNILLTFTHPHAIKKTAFFAWLSSVEHVLRNKYLQWREGDLIMTSGFVFAI